MDNKTAFNQLLERYREDATSTRHQGDTFERLTKMFLENDATYQSVFKNVYMWSDWALENGQNIQDTGIDLIGERHDGGITAIQCKFFASTTTINKEHLNSFLALSSKDIYTHRMFVDTTDVPWGKNAIDAIEGQTPKVQKVNKSHFISSTINWEFYLTNNTIGHFDKKVLRTHQKMSLEKTIDHFQENDRGKLIMACGTGKTFTSLKIAEEQAGKGKTVLYLVPSLALMAQTIREWFNDTEIGINAISVCSDQKVSKAHMAADLGDITTSNIPITVTTLPHELKDWTDNLSTEKMNVVFSTYQSIQAISDTQREHSMDKFDLVICDEAHRTAKFKETSKEESNFLKVHYESNIKSEKRLYMTATPKIFTKNAKLKAKQSDTVIASMDDKSLFGDEIYRVSFDYAVQHDLLTDYKVIVLALSEDSVKQEFQELLQDEDASLDIEFATKLLGCYKALCKVDLQDDTITDKNPMRRGIAFAKSIELSEDISRLLPKVVSSYKNDLEDKSLAPLNMEMEHIDGSFDADTRQKRLDWLQGETDDNTCRILSNARCLSEGVDVPTLDSVMFLHPKKSPIDIIQAVGRVMRKDPTGKKKMGYIILPVAVPAGIDPNKSLDNNKSFEVVWEVLNVLRSHDERLAGKINRMEFGRDISDKIDIICQSNVMSSSSKSTTNKSSELNKKDDQSNDTDGSQGQSDAQYSMDLDEKVVDAIKAQLVKNVGDRDYWEDWAEIIADIAQEHIARIKEILKSNAKAKSTFDDFVTELQDDLNPFVTNDDAIELLAQHLITKPVFDALFEDYDFTEKNPVSIAINKVLSVIQSKNLEAETNDLEAFYATVRNRVADTKTVDERQKLIVKLYDKFFKNAFPKTTKQLGIVYTPVEVVDFIIHSINDILVEEFKTNIGEKGVNIIDPFTGTGTFITRLLQSKLITPQQLKYKYKNEIHANEIVLLAYYIAGINIEQVYHQIMLENGVEGSYDEFNGICLTDTFQMYETEDMVAQLMPDNSERRKKQKELDIRVIMGNPPYSAGQKSANDNAQNVEYPDLDLKIKNSYVKHTTATNKNALYDSYIRAIRWGSDRIGKYGEDGGKGVMGYVTNGGWLSTESANGLRKCLVDEYSNLYVFNLRGDIRKNILSKGKAKEGGNIFDTGSQTGITITLFVKNPDKKSYGNIYYHDIGDDLKTKEKLSIIQQFKSINGITNQTQQNTENGQIGWQKITPDAYHDWINQRDDSFDEHTPMGDKKTKGKSNTQAIFHNFSNGLSTNRDPWCYNSSKNRLKTNMNSMIDFYNSEVDRYHAFGTTKEVKDFVSNDTKKIKWSSSLTPKVAAGIKAEYNGKGLVISEYRPFTKQWLYYDKLMNHRTGQFPDVFPIGANLNNRCICISGNVEQVGSFSTIMVDTVPNLHTLNSCQTFPLYLYDKNTEEGSLFDEETGDTDYFRKYAITDFAQERFSYGKEKMDKEDIFYYIYGILHHPDYTIKWEKNLITELPRIPKVETKDAFEKFVKAGRELAELHINYDSVEPYDKVNYLDKKGEKSAVLDPLNEFTDEHYRVEKMEFRKIGKDKDMTTIIYNDHITITDIPMDAYNYLIDGKSAIEWVKDRQVVKTDTASQITNDANDYAIETMKNPKYPLELLLKVITVSLKTQKIIKNLPPLEF